MSTPSKTTFYRNELTGQAETLLTKIGCYSLNDKTVVSRFLTELDDMMNKGEAVNILVLLDKVCRVLDYDISLLHEAKNLEIEAKFIRGKQVVNKEPFFYRQENMTQTD